MSKITAKTTRQRQFPTKISTTAFVRMYILHLLQDGSFYGNQIIDEIKIRLKNRWEPSPGMVYPLLNELESEGYIVGSWDEPNKRSIKRYRVTDKGVEQYRVLKLKNKKAIDDSLVILESILLDIYKE